MIRNRFELSSIISKFFALIFIIVLTHVGNAASLDPSPIVNGISSICPIGIGNVAGIPGPIEIFSSSATGPVPIVSGDEDANPSFAVVGVASTSGSGRIVALGHDGFFINYAMSLAQYDNRKFGINIINWLQNSQSNKKVLVTTGHGEPWVGGSDYEDFRNALEAQGYDVVITPGKITSDTLSGASILFMSCAGPSLEDDEIGYIQSFVANGGGLFLQGLGWAWVQYQHLPLEDCPMNKLAEPYGFRWIDGYISDSNHNYNGAPIFSFFYPSSGNLLNVPYFNQGNTQWCFLNSLSMVLQYYGENIYPWDLALQFNKYHDTYFDGVIDPIQFSLYIHNNFQGKLVSYYDDVAPFSIGFEDIEWFIGNDIPPIFSYKKHAIVIVGYSIEGSNKYVYIHDPQGLLWGKGNKGEVRDMDLMFIKVPWNSFKSDIDYEIFPRLTYFAIAGKPAVPEVNFYVIDENIIHYIDINGKNIIESRNYLDKGQKYITDLSYRLPSFPSFDFVNPWDREKINCIRWDEKGININNYQDSGSISISCSVRNPNDYETVAVLSVQVLKYNNLFEDIILNPTPVPSGKNNGQIDTISLNIPIADIGSGPCTIKLSDQMSGRTITKVDINIVSNKDIIIIARSPIFLEVMDPEGLVVNNSLNNTEGMYYIQMKKDNGTDTYDVVGITGTKNGLYQIKVFPKANVDLNDTYTLEVYSNGSIITLVENAPISAIPNRPYSIEVTDSKIVQPLTIDKNVVPSSAAPGASINFTINITNTGSMPLNHIQVIDHLPVGLSYISDNRSGSVSGRNVTWNGLPSLNIGESIFIKLITRVNPNASGNLTNLAEATGIRATEKQEEVSNSGYSTVRVVDVKEPKVRQNVERAKIGDQVAMATGNGRATNNIKVVSD